MGITGKERPLARTLVVHTYIRMQLVDVRLYSQLYIIRYILILNKCALIAFKALEMHSLSRM